ncbi:hypothetical protein N9D57_03215 [bacterium]|nr:hypothetical protein [bacterium]
MFPPLRATRGSVVEEAERFIERSRWRRNSTIQMRAFLEKPRRMVCNNIDRSSNSSNSNNQRRRRRQLR